VVRSTVEQGDKVFSKLAHLPKDFAESSTVDMACAKYEPFDTIIRRDCNYCVTKIPANGCLWQLLELAMSRECLFLSGLVVEKRFVNEDYTLICQAGIDELLPLTNEHKVLR